MKELDVLIGEWLTYTQRPKKRQRNNNQCFAWNAEDSLAGNDTYSNIVKTLVLNNIYYKLSDYFIVSVKRISDNQWSYEP